MAREGIPFILIFLVPSLVLLALGLWIGAVLCLALSAFMAFFFRDPERQAPSDGDVVVAPADGRVLDAGPLEPGNQASPSQISIFLSPLDVHINRSPIQGEIVDVEYKPGAFHIASRHIASVENEQNIVTVKGPKITVVVRQVAGVMARRLVLWKRAGDSVELGERIGLMKFGSRMDVILPPDVEMLARKGDRVKGGITLIGRLCLTAKPHPGPLERNPETSEVGPGPSGLGLLEGHAESK
jgi:phosphatidylserine decarboxylase